MVDDLVLRVCLSRASWSESVRIADFSRTRVTHHGQFGTVTAARPESCSAFTLATGARPAATKEITAGRCGLSGQRVMQAQARSTNSQATTKATDTGSTTSAAHALFWSARLGVGGNDRDSSGTTGGAGSAATPTRIRDASCTSAVHQASGVGARAWRRRFGLESAGLAGLAAHAGSINTYHAGGRTCF